jgi:hypothetical protein
MFKKKPKDDSDNKDSDISFGDDISGKQIIINVYNTLIKMLVK